MFCMQWKHSTNITFLWDCPIVRSTKNTKRRKPLAFSAEQSTLCYSEIFVYSLVLFMCVFKQSLYYSLQIRSYFSANDLQMNQMSESNHFQQMLNNQHTTDVCSLCAKSSLFSFLLMKKIEWLLFFSLTAKHPKD